MVSSKCCQGVSPSPLRFFAALIPPWAQTECERLTATMEKRSTSPPASAILMVAASPASPPPITMILGFAIIPLFLHCHCCGRQSFRRVLPLRTEERSHCRHSHHNKSDCDGPANHAKPPARPLTYCDAPFSAEEIKTISKVPRCSHNPDDIKRYGPGMLQLRLHLVKRRL